MGNKTIVKFKEKARELKYNLSALYLVYKRKDVSIYAKAVIIITVGYALSPIDLIPDFIPVIGYLDDIIIVPLLIYLALKLIPKEIMDECREEAKDMWKDGKPKKWYYAIPVIIIWLLIIFIIIKNIFCYYSASL
ncbi:hypothetical protein FACS189426_17400 [Bacteroidia bacterium]|nr:hypothetical protein FACS189426_17400 [Bacteroidia bacterium]